MSQVLRGKGVAELGTMFQVYDFFFEAFPYLMSFYQTWVPIFTRTSFEGGVVENDPLSLRISYLFCLVSKWTSIRGNKYSGGLSLLSWKHRALTDVDVYDS